MRTFFLLFLLIFSTFSCIHAAEKPFLEVRPKKGDGIYSLLRRYELLNNDCNYSKFLDINKLSRKSAIYSSKTYKLPIYKYKFNGKTIRSSIGITDYDIALSIQKYNERLFKKKLKNESFRRGEKLLLVPYHKLNCESNKVKPKNNSIPSFIPEEPEIADNSVPSSTGNRIFPIFGKKYQKTPLKSNKLKGKIFYLVGGHGGPDSGAVGTYMGKQLCEDEYAYDITLRLCRKLIEHGAIAYMITRDANDGIRSGEILPCDKDETTWKNQKIFRRQKSRLTQRSNAVNKLYDRYKSAGYKNQVMLSLHIDSRSSNKRADVFFYYNKNSTRGKKLAYKIRAKLKEKYKIHRKGGQYNGSVSSRDLHMLRETKPASVYIELGNIRNPSDQKRFVLESNRDVLAKWLFEGLTGFAP